jgi:hypothetical protein
MNKKQPNYVRIILKDGYESSCLRLVENDNEFHGYPDKYYYRDAGDWGVGFKIVDNKLISDSKILYGNQHLQLHNKDLIPVTKKEWKKCNKGYV